MTKFFIKGKPISVNGARKLPRNPPSCLLLFSVIPFNKIRLFSRGSIIFTIYSVSLFVSCSYTIPEPNNFELFLLVTFIPLSKKNF